MKIEVYNRYYEYDEIYFDIVKVEETKNTFVLYKRDGWSKEFSKNRYDYREV